MSEAQHDRYEAIFAAIPAPFAFVDLAAMRANAGAMLAQSGGLPIRVASKSVRSRPVLERILALDPGFRGILSFTLPERSTSTRAASATSSSATRPRTAPRSRASRSWRPSARTTIQP